MLPHLPSFLSKLPLLGALPELALQTLQNRPLPDWLVRELQQRLVLFLNHVLQHEPEAQKRLRVHQGKAIHATWVQFSLGLQITPVGLLNLRPADAVPASADLRLTVLENSPLALLQMTQQGKRPELRIEGDVQLAAELGWQTEHVRWDHAEDLARLLGDAPAQALQTGFGRLRQAVQAFLSRRGAQSANRSAGTGANTSAASASAHEPATA
jgi:ubiquinone biosynthesis accessory factor UbiJ